MNVCMNVCMRACMYVYMHTYMGQEEDVRAAKNAAYKDMDKKRRLLQLHPLSTRDSLMVGHLTCLSPPDRRRLSLSGEKIEMSQLGKLGRRRIFSCC